MVHTPGALVPGAAGDGEQGKGDDRPRPVTTMRMAITSDDLPLDLLFVQVEPWMPEHGHGVNEPPVVTVASDGTFVAEWSYSMPGLWEVTIEIEGEPGVDAAVVAYDVE